MKTIVVFSFCFLMISGTFIFAQNSPVSAGGDATGLGGKVSYSVGQTFYTTNTGTNGSVAQGVQQPYEISVITAVNGYEGVSLQLSVYPNPVSDFLLLKVVNDKHGELSYLLYDINGKLLTYKNINDKENKIDMQNYAPAVYFLNVFDGGNVIKEFKIIKN